MLSDDNSEFINSIIVLYKTKACWPLISCDEQRNAAELSLNPLNCYKVIAKNKYTYTELNVKSSNVNEIELIGIYLQKLKIVQRLKRNWKSFENEFHRLNAMQIDVEVDGIKGLLRNVTNLVSEGDLEGVVRGILRIQKSYRYCL